MSKGKYQGICDLLGLCSALLIFVCFGILGLGQFITVDEPKWLYTRVFQLYFALTDHNWAATYVNDKPGLLPALLAGVVNYFLDLKTFNALEIERYLFWWRLPILLFNAALLILLYHYLRGLVGRTAALFSVMLAASNPLLIGISRIVNPDATLWSTGAVSMTAFLLYAKTGARRYVVSSAFFLTLALLSKFAATFFYPAFFMILFLGYLSGQFDRIDFIRRSLGWIACVALSMLFYFCLFPATWENPMLLLNGTVNFGILRTIRLPFAVFAGAAIGEAWLLKGRVTGFLQRRLPIDALLSAGAAVAILGLFVYLIGYNLVDENFWGNIAKGVSYRGSSQSKLFPNFPINDFVTFVTLNLATLAGVIGGCASAVVGLYAHRGKQNGAARFPMVMAWLVALAFLMGAALAGYLANARYQIIVYPILAIAAGVAYGSIPRGKALVFAAVAIASAAELWTAKPYYYCYTNALNTRDILITEAWGLGGFELAQKVNAMPNAEELKIWADREGFRTFSISDMQGWNEYPSDIEDLDYLVLTARGNNMSRKGKRGGTITEYYDLPGEIEIHVAGNPKNYVKLVPYDGRERPFIPKRTNEARPLGYLDLSQPNTVSFWVLARSAAPGPPISIGKNNKSEGRIFIESIKMQSDGSGIYRFQTTRHTFGQKELFGAYLDAGKVARFKWQHVVWYQTGGGPHDEWGLYFDGEKVGTAPMLVEKSGRALVEVNRFNGLVSNAKILNRVVSPSEVQAFFEEGPDLPGIQ